MAQKGQQKMMFIGLKENQGRLPGTGVLPSRHFKELLGKTAGMREGLGMGGQEYSTKKERGLQTAHEVGARAKRGIPELVQSRLRLLSHSAVELLPIIKATGKPFISVPTLSSPLSKRLSILMGATQRRFCTVDVTGHLVSKVDGALQRCHSQEAPCSRLLHTPWGQPEEQGPLMGIGLVPGTCAPGTPPRHES